MKIAFRLVTAVLASAVVYGAQAPRFSDTVRGFVKIDAPVVALTNVRVIDGTGAPAKENQTIVLRGGNIAEIGDAARVKAPDGATTIDLTGKSVIPGLVMVHEHLYYPTGPGIYGQLGLSFVRLYLAGGVTTMRTGGNVNGFMDLKLKQLIEQGQQPGPAIDATAPYGLKITGHLCSVTYAEAADLGIDNLEHGFLASTDFVADKQPDVCPGQTASQRTIAALDENGEPFKALVKKLVEKKVALTSTLTVFETFTPGRPMPPGLEVLLPELKQQFAQNYQRTAQNEQSVYKSLFPRALALERAFARAGGMLIAGTDPTGGGGVVPGYANQRQLELLVEEGFTPVEAIRIGTLNGAAYLGRAARVGSIAPGKQADLVVIDGDPSKTIADVRKVETVFKQGVGFDPAKLVASVSGKVGLW